MTNELRIQVQINSRYKIFDTSGQIPFSVAFGLIRRSQTDENPHPIRVETTGSILDVQYALGHGLLKLQEQDAEGSAKWKEVNITPLKDIAKKDSEPLYLPSPVHRADRAGWRDHVTVYQCHIDPDGRLASMLARGKRYRIKLSNDEDDNKRWAHDEQKNSFSHDGTPDQSSEPVKVLLTKRSAGNASFTVVKKDPIHLPKLDIKMKICESVDDGEDSFSRLEVVTATLASTASGPITIQTRGHQSFLMPWGPYGPEPGWDDSQARIIDPAPPHAPIGGIQVVDPRTREIVWKREMTGYVLTQSNLDRRPKFGDVLVIHPGVPIVRKISIAKIVTELKDGHFKIRIRPRGCRWWDRDITKGHDADERIPLELGGRNMPPVVLESEDEVEIHLSEGKIEA